MIEISNLRTEKGTEWTKLVCDIDVTEIFNPFAEKTMWFAVKNENSWMFSTQVYDCFFLVPLYLAMYYGTDLKINGNVSRKLYRNMMNYGQQILCNFSDSLKKVKVYADGFDVVEKSSKKIVGGGISCGIDSLSTIYDRFVKETDEDYRINNLFIFNCGTHGAFDDPKTRNRFLSRYELNKKAADEMNLPVYQVDSNLHSFTNKLGEQRVGYLAIHSCIISLQKVIQRYYIASTYSYNEIMTFGKYSHDFDMAEFADSYLIPLIQTEGLELILEGTQYKRSEKTELIADWDIARKHLNVCVAPVDGARNCSKCSKCMRTLIPLEAMGKSDDFSKVFDLGIYRKNAYKNKLKYLMLYGKEGFATDIVDFARKKGLKLPSFIEQKLFQVAYFGKRILKKFVKR